MTTYPHENPLELAQELVATAWAATPVNKSYPTAAGEPTPDNDRLWQQCVTTHGAFTDMGYTKPCTAFAGRLFGRNVNLRLSFDDAGVTLRDGDVDTYSEWRKTYPTYKDLYDAAVKTLELRALSKTNSYAYLANKENWLNANQEPW